jgi:hypothetical protein
LMLENTQFLLQEIPQGTWEYIVSGGGYTSLMLENTQVWCWRVHSFYCRKSLSGTWEYTIFWRRIHKFDVGEYTVFTIANPLTPKQVLRVTSVSRILAHGP